MKLYMVGLAGESNYQPAIRACHEGERVFVCREADNPYDKNALRVETAAGVVIGYVPKSSWLGEAIREQGRGVTATIKTIGDGGSGTLGVVLNVTLTDDDVPERRYGVSTPAIAPPDTGIAGVFRRLFS